MSLTVHGVPEADAEDNAGSRAARLASVDQKRRFRLLQGLAVSLGVALLVSQSGWSPAAQAAMFRAGLALALLCIIGRLWSILYIGPVKSLKLVERGPFAMTRNPLYFFSSIGAAGIGFLFGSAGLAFLLFVFASQVFVLTARKEERFLDRRFGAAYRAYCRKTPRFWPDLRKLNFSGEVHPDLPSIARTLVDGLWFLAPVPVAVLLDGLRIHGLLPSLLTIF